ncbi:MAG TPA: hypothetical protein VD931_13005, partial [Baekduia sp.]|nr:hypothetical protein [Baekduia sp.]
MTRRRRRVLLAAAVLVFLVVSAGLARVLAVEGQERDAILDLLRAQARGDATAVLEQLDACDARCTRDVRAAVARVAGPGDVKLVRLDSG